MAFTQLTSGDDWYCVFGANDEWVNLKKIIVFTLGDGIEVIPMIDNGLGTPVDATELKDFIGVTKNVQVLITRIKHGLPTVTGKQYRDAMEKGAISSK